MLHQRGWRALWGCAACLAVFCAGANVVGQQPLREGWPVPLEVEAMQAAHVVQIEGSATLVYEIVVRNPSYFTIVLDTLDVLRDTGEVLASYDSDALSAIASVVPPDGEATAESTLALEPGEQVLLFLWIAAPVSESAIEGVRHRFGVSGESRGEPVSLTLETLATPVVDDAIVIDAPVRGGRWWVTNGFQNDSNHRRFYIVDDVIKIPQRFGSDYHKLDADGNNANGAETDLESYVSFDEPLYAVADGVVVAVRDGLADRRPTAEHPTPITWETLPGNYVILEIGPDRYASYVHLREGSVQVAAGDVVQRGELIGRVGNSGNSEVPHLHFHVSDSPSVNGANGVPFVFRRFEKLQDDYFFRDTDRPLSEEGDVFENCVGGFRSIVRFPE